MRIHLLTLIALVAISSSFFTRVQGAGGLLNKITDKVGDVVGIGGDDDKKDDDKKDEKKESLYEGGLKQQIAHTVIDATFDRAIEYGKENAPSSIMKPMLSIAGSTLKKKAHQRVNAMDDDEEKEKREKEEKEGNEIEAKTEAKEIGGDVEGAKDLVKEKHGDDDDEKKKGGLKGLLGIGDRRK